MYRKRKRCPKEFTTTGTQTEIPTVAPLKNLVVNIPRLKNSELQRLLSKRKKSSVLRPGSKVRKSVSRLPSNYSHFVRPINNNEVANSTGFNLTEEHTSSDARSLRAPVALAEPAAEKLTTVPEYNTNSFVTPLLHDEIVSVEVHEVPLQTTGMADGGGGSVDFEECAAGPEEVLAMQVSSGSKVSRKGGKDGAYIRINAKTVNIHVNRLWDFLLEFVVVEVEE